MFKNSLVIICLLISVYSFSQDEGGYVSGDNTTSSLSSGGGFNWDKVTIGGGLGLSFGSFTIIEIAPNFGYYITENILSGIGLRYSYYSDNRNNISTSVYGARVYTEYLFNDLPILAHAEAELLNVEWFANTRKDIINLYIGGGIKQKLGGNSYMYILGLWNLNETKDNIVLQQPNPLIRAGITIGM